jgi:HPt (histidine-containing phosphotransfer) domain-containing protein
MVELTQTVMKAVFAPPLVPVERSIDVEHLARMTLGDRALEREVLGLFVRQAEMLRTRMETATVEVIGAAAHTLKGSATGIGAVAIARASADIEAAVEACDHRHLQTAMAGLDMAISQIVAEISENLRSDAVTN